MSVGCFWWEDDGCRCKRLEIFSWTSKLIEKAFSKDLTEWRYWKKGHRSLLLNRLSFPSITNVLLCIVFWCIDKSKQTVLEPVTLIEDSSESKPVSSKLLSPKKFVVKNDILKDKEFVKYLALGNDVLFCLSSSGRKVWAQSRDSAYFEDAKALLPSPISN